jgi:hypothetical protein
MKEAMLDFDCQFLWRFSLKIKLTTVYSKTKFENVVF